MAFTTLGNSNHDVVSVSIDFSSNSKGDCPFDRMAFDFSLAVCGGLPDHLRSVPWRDIFNLGASSAFSELMVEIDVYILIFFLLNIMPSLVHIHGFQLLVLLP